MASRRRDDDDPLWLHHGPSHLDPSDGRQVVFCHSCRHEWYREDHAQEPIANVRCPECRSDIIEIVEPDNDPRNDTTSSMSESPPRRFHIHDDDSDFDVDDDEEDSDPEEADIEEHVGPHGFTFRRSVRAGPDHPHHHHHHNPGPDPVVERFFDMIQNFGPPRGATTGLFGGNEANPENTRGGNAQTNTFQPGTPAPFQPRIQRTTFTSGAFGGGTTSVTIVSGPMPRRPMVSGASGAAGGDPFQMYASSLPDRAQQRGGGGISVTTVSMSIGTGANPRSRIFSNIMRDIGPPGERGNREDQDMGGGPAFARSLHDILTLISPANAMAGDAVYSQEALDRIITNLMEANPQSNAAPPASEEALRSLERKTVDQAMLGNDGKTECPICIDEMKEGDKALLLPCKHWFHEDCVVLWLKEHNTCPICRTPIEKNEGNGNGNGNNPPSNDNQSPGQNIFDLHGAYAPTSQRPPTPGPNASGHPAWFSGPLPSPGGSSQSENRPERPRRFSRPPSQSQSRLNEVLRNMSSQQRELERDRDRDRDRNRDRDRDRGSTSGFSYDTSRLQRRSHSPTSPRPAGFAELGARMRQRSPSQGSRQSSGDSRRQSASGAWSWLRDRFGGSGGGSGGSSSRDGRRN